MLPANQVGGGTLKLSAQLNYKPHVLPGLCRADRPAGGRRPTPTSASRRRREIRLKNTLEVALVLDNSGSMDNTTASGQKRIDLLKAAAKELVKTLADQAKLIKQVDKPVQFSLVPFAASVNVGPDNAGADWMDVNGLSPVHQENFDWSTLNAADKTRREDRRHLVQEGHRLGRRRGPDADPLFALSRHEGGYQPRTRGRQRTRGLRRVSRKRHLQAQPQGIRLRRHLRAFRQLARLRGGPALLPTTPTTTPTGGSDNTGIGSAIRRPCSCRCSRRTNPAITGSSRRTRTNWRPSPTAPPTVGGTTTRRAPPAGRASRTWRNTSCRGRSTRRSSARAPGRTTAARPNRSRR